MRSLLTCCVYCAILTTAYLNAQEPIRPFTIRVEDSVLTDLRARIDRTRWPDQIERTGWEYGVDTAYLKQLVEYWRTKYDWRVHERALNQFPQFHTRIDGVDLHFLHVRSPHQHARALVLVHGWPGSVYEFYKIIPMLTEPEKHGGNADDAFHVVCPSLPGFGFSEKPKERGWSSQRMAESIAKLMARIGYDRYGAQGGDWGGGIVRWLASNDGGHCIGAHNNFPSGVGATNSKAEFPTQSPYTPQDLLATIYRHLGIDITRTFTDFSGRPVSILSDAQLIRELI